MKLSSKKIFILIFFVLLAVSFVGLSIFLIIQQRTAQPTELPQNEGQLPIEKPATLHVITGTVTITNINTNEVRVANKNQDFVVSQGDRIQTDTNTIANVDFHDGTLIRLSSESAVIYGKEDKTIRFQQIFGNVYYRFKKTLGITEALEVETNTAVAAVRGTTLAVFRYDHTKLVVSSSSVDLYQRDQLGKALPESKVEVPSGMQSETASDSAHISYPLTTAPATLTTVEQAWLDFNNKADELYEKGALTNQDLETLEGWALTYVEQTLITPTPTLTLTPTPTFTPAKSPTPTVPPIPKISEMFGTGYNTGLVQTESGSFSLTCLGANKNSTRVITDSANENDCANDCPVKPLAEYVSSNGGYAGMNGMYFCPPDYPACAGKTNSFDTLFFNSRVRRYINSDNNVYSVIPFLVIDGGGNPRFIARSQEWGRDTGIQAGIAGNPMLIQGGNNVVGNYSLEDRQRSVKSNRAAFVQKGDNIYLCVTKVATVPDSAVVFKTLNVDNAINIDGGGSTAMYVNGSYKFGPGRALPNAIIFAHR